MPVMMGRRAPARSSSRPPSGANTATSAQPGNMRVPESDAEAPSGVCVFGGRDAIEASEGRVIVQELSLFRDAAMLEPITDAELACAFGADLILLNAFDCVNPHVAGITAPADQTIHTLKRYIGRLIGLNLEPVGTSETLGELEAMPEGRAGTVENALRARDLGFDFILLTGNPGTGVDNAAIVEATRAMREALGDDMLIFAGKMHAAGSRPRRTFAPLRRRAPTSFSFPPPAPCPACPSSSCTAWSPTFTSSASSR